MRFRHPFHHERRPGATPHPAARARRSPSLGAGGSSLGDETEAWLNGELAALRGADRECLSPWMLVNRLAHADLDVVRDVARGEAPPVPPTFGGYPTWAAAERSLAQDLFHEGVRPEQVTALQRGVLVPLELRLIEQAEAAPLTLGQVVAAVSKALTADR
jgi:hypothetical protein